ncbi:hypothetical protein [Methylobacterium sp. Leaf93]|uniref:hypothetical protein n=1 Tax=Methylobacterium sp. Leaf93 TaxID=1736249 RepID=UPI0006F8ACF6|nr:hypothetical protein [Methylobacterium sp. Leaf93]KQP02660.1 hypothetical protein ASF26_14620 [Methylobacterium sp. Leaf93]
MLVRKVTPERRAELDKQALAEIQVFRDRLARQESQGPQGFRVRLVLKACRACLDWWERRVRKAQ